MLRVELDDDGNQQVVIKLEEIVKINCERMPDGSVTDDNGDEWITLGDDCVYTLVVNGVS